MFTIAGWVIVALVLVIGIGVVTWVVVGSKEQVHEEDDMNGLEKRMYELGVWIKDLIALQQHNHDLLHLVLLRQGLTKEQLDQLLAAKNNTAEWQRLIGSLSKPTDDLAKAVQANQ